MRRISNLFTCLAGIGLLATASMPSAAEEIVVGLQCDRTGPTQIIGINLCPGYHDYVKLINSKGGIDGHTVRVLEIDHEYKVPPAVESYQSFKKEGAVLISLYGTPQSQALTQKLFEDKIPGTLPGFGTATAADGEAYPYLFPMAATYWSQAAAAVQFAKEELGGSLQGKKIAYLFYDNPGGREPLPVLEKLQELEGFELRSYAVPPPGVEVSTQVLDIKRRYRADYIISHLFGRAPSLQIKELKRAGFPLDKVISFVWGHSEADIKAAGGFDAADGYAGMQFSGVGQDYPILDEIRQMYAAQGEDAPKEMASSVFYNRGVMIAAVQIAALRNAVSATGSADLTGDAVKAGFEAIDGLDLGGLVPPLAFSAADHEGGGWVQIFRVKEGRFQAETDWFTAYNDVVKGLLKDHRKN